MSLDRHSLGIIISRIIGIYVLVQAIGYVAFASMNLLDMQVSLSRLVPAITALLTTLGLSYFFLAHAPRAGQFLMSGTKAEPDSGRIDESAVLRTTFMIIGIFLLAQAIPSVVAQAALSIQGKSVGPTALAHTLETITRLLLGLMMVTGGEFLERLLRS